MQAVRFVRKRVGVAMPVKVVNFDWHGNMGRLSEEKGIEGFWQFMDPVLRQVLGELLVGAISIIIMYACAQGVRLKLQGQSSYHSVRHSAGR